MTRRFTKDHEWIELAGDVATVGITDFAQSQLGDITFVELPQAGTALSGGDSAAVVDSVKAASDVYSPAGGSVREVNAALEDQPELVNTAAESDGWLWRMTVADPAELDALMDDAAYQEYVTSL
jgi:glycine cleavage system H protein